MLFADLVATSAAVAATRSRKAKIEAIAECLRRADADEIAIVVSYLSGQLRQRRTGVGWASLRDRPTPADVPTLGVSEVDAAYGRLERTAGAGSVAARRTELGALLGRATADEQQMLVLLVGGELRQGAQAGVMADAIARAADVPLATVRRAAMLAGDLPSIADTAMQRGAAGLAEFGLRVGTPVQPMLASTAPSLDDAMEKIADAAVEWKLDGIRVQVHRDGDDVAVFTRSLDEITERVPEIVAAARALRVQTVVLDGEAIALRADQRPLPFQQTASRAASQGELEQPETAVALTPFVFDVLHADGADLIDQPISGRYEVLDAVLLDGMRVPRLLSNDPAAATEFYDDALARGHEGVVVKELSSPYEAGRRGKGWVKVKPRHTLDLVVLAVEWGHGRRQGWLSNLHLGARDPSGGFVMLGKTFKGMTDEMLAWQTERFLELETSRDAGTVYVRPELVVEIAFDGIQTSPRYPGGVALRFARVLRYREDKRAAEADTIDLVRSLHSGGA